MRPVARGKCPAVKWNDYNEARPDLEKAIGDYCSYCEMPNASDVEHKLPKLTHPNHKMNWNNFLLSCKYCNSIKNVMQSVAASGTPKASLVKYYWPDTDNTARAFVYQPNNEVVVSPALSGQSAAVAAGTIRMIGLNRVPGKIPGPSHKDKRWIKRQQAWDLANTSLADLMKTDTVEMRSTIARLAAASGFWSVWRTVFVTDLDVVRRLDMVRRIDKAFCGTDHSCFDPNTAAPIGRKGGKL